ncbi:glycosyltransferase family 4 protein [Methanothermobacter sp.]|uniref:glycosyltransferase family 4 protein n=1 Tax=Methanothermobacter sp. TaxID=1884223 RepID=UPI00262B7B8A|nr:glycosyltransferase family 4 protein [Methanothermobacter sp.]MDI9617670.1 glycosyltransferase family 4 protein [Methanothermobacter sp.]
MHILMVSPYFYPEGGGAEFYMYKIAEGLSKDHEVTVLCTSNEETHPLNHDKIEVNTLSHHFKISTTPVALTGIREMVNYMRRNNFDLCNINYYLPLFPDMATMACRICKIPSVLTWHNDVHTDGFLKLFSTVYNHTLNKITLRMVDKIITPSPYCYNESPLLRKFQHKMEWVPPGVDLEKYNRVPLISIREKYGIPENRDIILFVGVMNKSTAHKGVNTLLRAFKEIYKDTDSYLVMVGKGDMIPYYLEKCKKLGIIDRVIFTGFVEEEILINLYREAEILVLPSTTIQEGFGMVLIEANACGTPVIGSAVGGIKYVIRDGETGLLVSPGDPEVIGDVMKKLLDDKELTDMMGATGRKMVLNNYSWEKSVRMTEKVFEDTLKQFQ